MKLPKGTKLPEGHFYFSPKYPTDKFETGLMGEYKNIFQSIRLKPIQFLEIGTGQGGSLRYFEDYFIHPKTRIIGVDRQMPFGEVTFKDSTKIFIGDQNDSEFLLKIGKEEGKFDIVLDDGAHSLKETQNTYQNLFRFVKPGGYYIIEDWAGELRDGGDKYKGMANFVTRLAKKHSLKPFADIDSGSEVTLKLGHSFSYLVIRKRFV